MTNIINWIKANILLAVGGLILIVFLFVPSFRRMLFPRRLVHHRRPRISIASTRPRRRVNRRPLPRSVGMHKASGRGYPKVGGGYVPFKRNKDGSIKKAKFVGGTIAAHNYMRSLRRNR